MQPDGAPDERAAKLPGIRHTIAGGELGLRRIRPLVAHDGAVAIADKQLRLPHARELGTLGEYLVQRPARILDGIKAGWDLDERPSR
jgi:hypothetical protein